jgi:hypothetical protein
MSNLPAHVSLGSTHPAALTRRDRRELVSMESTATLELVDLQLRQQLAQAGLLAETAVTNTAMASVTGTAACAAALRKAVPEVAEALQLLQTRHVLNAAQRIDRFAQGRR